MNEGQLQTLTEWAERLVRQRADFTNLICAERGRGNLNATEARVLLVKAGYHPDQVDRIL